MTTNTETKAQATHTKGPWTFQKCIKGTIIGPDYRTPIGRQIAVVGKEAESIEVELANARLIAAAPELLEACKKAAKRDCGCWSNTGKDWHGDDCHKPKLLAAIRAAEGA